MSKKHFIKLADTLASITRHDDGQTVEFAAVINALADFCEGQNPHFMRGRWLQYIAGECGPSGGRVRRAA
jgi:hypothetical protein